MNRKLLASHGLKWNPFAPDQPVEALWRPTRIEHFCWRVEQLAQEGGFALILGEPGTGKSVALRLLSARLGKMPDLVVGSLDRPQSNVGDFYRELGHLFGVPMSTSNRWGGFQALRELWKAHVDSTLYRPVLICDEASVMETVVLSELRILSSQHFDSRSMLMVVFAGDMRFTERIRSDKALLPLGSRIRPRLTLEPRDADELMEFLGHLLEQAGNPGLMTKELQRTLAEHAMGNLRALCNMGHELLSVAIRDDRETLDEGLYFELYGHQGRSRRAKKTKRGGRP